MTGCYKIEELLDKTVAFIEDLFVGLKKKETTRLKRLVSYNRMSAKDFNKALKEETRRSDRETKATIMTLGQMKKLGFKVVKHK